MSRHKTVKAMSDAIVKSQPVDDEYEYYDEEDGEEEYDPDAAEQQMREAVSAARTILGEDFSESEIRESLWHYYYDVDKTVNYLLSLCTPISASIPVLNLIEQRTASQDKTAPKKAKGWLLTDFSSPMPPSCASVNRHPRSAASSTALVGRGSIAQDADPPHVESPGHLMAGCGRALTAAEFFKDSPWLNIPMERRSEILVEPLHPRGGLLGGSSQGTGKPSKLAALAAARKKKENDKASTDSKGASNSLALLDKLGTKPKASETKASTETSYESSVLADQTKHQESAPKPRKYPVRQKMQEVQKPASKPEEINTISTVTPVAEPTPEPPVLTSPSHFAQAMIGGSSSKAPSSSDSEPHLTRYTVFPENNAENPFAGPSPDDIVSKAQSASKGISKSERPTVKE
jgi:elongation factor 1 alpha-like protein